MGMYTEFYFRANVKDGDFADWLDTQINHDGGFETRFSETDFPNDGRWYMPFIGGGAVYQESRRPVFRRKAGYSEPYHHQLVLASSYKGGTFTADKFVAWIAPHLEMYVGDFLGYSLYEDSDWDDPDGTYREHPTLYFMPDITPGECDVSAGEDLARKEIG
jgi:hypothetical protein